MEYFLAVSDKQLGLCPRLLYAEGIRAIVETVRNSKGKIEFHIKANTDEIKAEQKEQRKTNTEFVTRLTAVEASAKQAHKRIDTLERAHEE